jgi:hypothetical protein
MVQHIIQKLKKKLLRASAVVLKTEGGHPEKSKAQNNFVLN